MPRSSGKLRGTVVALAFLAAACGGPEGSRGVRVEDITTNVGLGVEVILDSAPANITVTRPVPRQQLELPQHTLPPLETVPPTPRMACPRAGTFEFPALDAGVDPDPDARPVPGSYPWKLEGTVITDAGDQTVDEFETRELRDVQDDSVNPGAFRFTTTQKRFFDERPGDGTLETTYRVVPVGQARDVPNPPAGPNVSDTGRGLYLVSIVFKGTDAEGRPVESRFEPTSPLHLLKFPVRQGEVIDTSGTDPQTGMQVSISGEVTGKKQVDACGKRVDSWLVEAVQNVRVTDPQTLQTQTFEAHYDYSVAPQFGSMLLYERIEAPREGPIVSVESRIGRVPERSTESG